MPTVRRMLTPMRHVLPSEHALPDLHRVYSWNRDGLRVHELQLLVKHLCHHRHLRPRERALQSKLQWAESARARRLCVFMATHDLFRSKRSTLMLE
jgi:hypothetical protein